MATLNETIFDKWEPVLSEESEGAPKLEGRKARYMARLLENTEKELKHDQSSVNMSSLFESVGAAPTNIAGGINNYDPVLISLIRRSMPNLIAYDICGVQPMTGPTGLIFALTPHYSNQTGTVAFYVEPNTGFSTVTAGNTTIGQAANNVGGNSSVVVSGNSSTYNFAGGMATAQAEALGSSANVDFAQMGISIEKVTVTAQSRALAASYSIEMAQDMKAVHGLDAETELTTILSAEILAEINREIIRTVVLTATAGSQATTVAGTFDLDVDANGRWSAEKFKGLLAQIEFECNAIAKQTRRGKGNIIVCSSNVASALAMAGVLDYAPAINSAGLQVDDTGNTFAGVIMGRIKVYIDPYSGGDYFVVGYRGPSPFDAGLFYAPYVPLQMVRAVGQDTFQPKLGFKTRYGVVANPLSPGATTGTGALIQNANVFYRRSLVANLF